MFRQLYCDPYVCLSSSFESKDPCSVCDEVAIFDNSWFQSLDQIVKDHESILQSGRYNFEDCKIPISSNLNIDFFRFMLSNYEDKDICTFLEYGFPIGYENSDSLSSDKCVQNHKGTTEYPIDINKYLKKNNKPYCSWPFSF